MWEKDGRPLAALADKKAAARLAETALATTKVSMAEVAEIHKAVAEHYITYHFSPNPIGIEAAAFATKAVELSEYKNWKNLEVLARSYVLVGDYASAVPWLEAAIGAAPESEHGQLQKKLTSYQKSAGR
jgi:hypothetical protein